MNMTEWTYSVQQWKLNNPQGTGESDEEYAARLAEYFYEKGRSNWRIV